jgi:hypothetical protein
VSVLLKGTVERVSMLQESYYFRCPHRSSNAPYRNQCHDSCAPKTANDGADGFGCPEIIPQRLLGKRDHEPGSGVDSDQGPRALASHVALEMPT